MARIVSGSFSDRLFSGRYNPNVPGFLLVTTPIISLLPGIDSITVLLATLVVAGFIMQMRLVLLFPYVRKLVDRRVTATAFSVLNLVEFAGTFSTPLLTGVRIEKDGRILDRICLCGRTGGRPRLVVPNQPRRRSRPGHGGKAAYGEQRGERYSRTLSASPDGGYSVTLPSLPASISMTWTMPE